MEVLTAIFMVFVGAWMVLFNRRFSLGVLQSQHRLLKIDVTETRVKWLQVFAVVLGTSIVIVSLVGIAQRLS